MTTIDSDMSLLSDPEAVALFSNWLFVLPAFLFFVFILIQVAIRFSDYMVPTPGNKLQARRAAERKAADKASRSKLD